MKIKWTTLFILLLLIIVIFLIVGDRGGEQETGDLSLPDEEVEQVKHKEGYGVSSSNPVAVEVGMRVLEQGGNAVDAAVAVSFALGVAEPYGSGLGGGGTMLVLPKPDVEPVVYDYRETAPREGRKNSTGVPGLVKGMHEVHHDYGVKSLYDLLEPSIDIAEGGFVVDTYLSQRIHGARHRIDQDAASHFFPDDEAIKGGETLRQEDLAETLKRLQEYGLNDFYEGDIAEDIANNYSDVSKRDLEEYEVVKTKAAKGSFYGYDVYTAGPPTAGITLIQMLQMAEAYKLDRIDKTSADYIHLLGEMAKQAYNDRLSNISDPKFTEVNTEKLASEKYSSKMASEISTVELSASFDVNDTPADENNHNNTTHFVVMDQDGMVVSATNTLSNFFGSGNMVEGFFLNNQLANFSSNDKSPNAYEPQKSPRSFITPTIVRSEDGDDVMGIGTPGGRRIPQILTQVMISAMFDDISIQEALDQPRFIVEDDEIFIEEDMPDSIVSDLRNKGYLVKVNNSDMFYGGVQVLSKFGEDREVTGAADKRRSGVWKARSTE
ncbi:capsule anchoring protein CapD [Alkalihalophilus pseudofirmus OF4]|uniref:Capsule anchoring protein CapD n=1 Tax=Alkalihalophilus pseudofirmus (strain ATCC BAA-2126 / JCM 17055 / OF4) TaxID=398511 RepID=D3G0B1_ALKPO|nr:gamma-glutamyltransferase family protein [Alkalihalophilus pseudofirmus]ADC49386.1 capsule anchoring protein CapD [Alkalihalophilus pseudofirmus OF4]